jgi:hypothetical protein
MHKENPMQNWRSVTDVVTAERMIMNLAGMCNGASSWDGAGFSKTDVQFGHSLAAQAAQGRAWSMKQASAALKMITKYARQLGGKEQVCDWMQAPNFACLPQAPGGAREQRSLRSDDQQAVFQFKFQADLVAHIKQIRGSHKGEKYWASWHADTRTWRVPVNAHSIMHIMQVARDWEFEIEERFEIYYSKVMSRLGEVQEAAEESRVAHALGMNQELSVGEGQVQLVHADPHVLVQFRALMNQV